MGGMCFPTLLRGEGSAHLASDRSTKRLRLNSHIASRSFRFPLRISTPSKTPLVTNNQHGRPLIPSQWWCHCAYPPLGNE